MTSETSDSARFGLSRDELNAAFEELGDGEVLTEDFMDSEHWPTEGLSDRQVELLTGALQKVERAKRRESLLGRLGLKR